MADSGKDVNKPPHFTYIWTIENMCFPCKVDSPTFTVKEMEMTKWYLTIDADFLEFVVLNIWRDEEDDGPESIEIKFELSFLGIDGLTLIEKVGVEKFENCDCFEFEEFADKHEVFFRRRAEFLPKEALTIRLRMWRTGTEIARLDSCFARTLLRANRRSFVWAIREFSTLEPYNNLKIFLSTTSTRQLNFNLFVKEEGGEEYINIDIRDSGDEDCDLYKIKIYLLDSEGKVMHSAEQFERDNLFLFYEFFKKGILMNNKASLLPNDVLTLRCEIEMDADIVWSVIENYRYVNSMISDVIATDTGEILLHEQGEVSDVSSSLTKAIKSLLDEGTASDVSLRAGSKSFPTHKCILSARSPVFKAMFSGDMKEKTSKCIEIPDIDEDTLGELLSYIYTDKVRYLEWPDVADLYRAADIYELLDLKKRCAKVLKSDLSVSSVCAVLDVADMHQDQELREAAQRFVMRQGAKFFTSDTWRSFKEENSMLAWEIVERILCNMKRQ